MRFPQVTGSNLLRQKVTLPDDLRGELNILFVAFYQWHQAQVDSWIPLARQFEKSFPGVQFYETPVIQKMNLISKTFINEGMRAGIPNQTTREKTITLYIDKEEFRRALDIPNEENIWVLVLDGAGNVLWRTQGAYSPEQGEALLHAIQEQHPAATRLAST
jgi:ATP10 protein